MVSEAHCMSFPCTELLLFNYAKVKTVFHSVAPLNIIFPIHHFNLQRKTKKPCLADILKECKLSDGFKLMRVLQFCL